MTEAITQPALFDTADVVGTAGNAARIRARVCHPSGTPARGGPPVYSAPEMGTSEIRAAAAALDHADLVALIMALCTGTYPRIARDSVIAELARRNAP
jgi:hypothetical protein